MSKKKADLVVNLLKGNVPNFDNIIAQNGELELRDADTYWNSDKVKQSFLDANGNPDKRRFDEFYKDASKLYNEYANHQYDINNIEGLVLDNPITQALGLKTIKKPATFTARAKNPYGDVISAIGINKVTPGSMTIEEIAFNGTDYYDREKDEFIELGDNMSGIFDWGRLPKGNPLVVAQWDKDGTHIDPATGNKTLHVKGEPKLHPIKLKPYAETLDGRDVTDKRMMTFGNSLTEEGTWINKYDFFDSDDRDKHWAGVIAKTTAEIAPLFIPYFGTAYGLAYAGKSLLDAGAEIYKSFDIETPKDEQRLANSIQGFLNQYKSTVTQKSQEELLTFENFGNMLSSIAVELKSQIGVAKLPAQLKALSNVDKVRKKLQETGKLSRMSEFADTLGDPKKLREALGKSYDNAVDVSRATSLLYNTAIASKQIGDSFDEAGIGGSDKALGMAVGLAGLGALFGLVPTESWFLKPIALDDVSIHLKSSIKDFLTDFKFNANAAPEVKAKGFKKAFDKVYSRFKIAPEKLDSVNVTSIGGAATAEALEENTEVIFTEGIKTLHNTLQELGYTEDKTNNFKDIFGENFWKELGLSTVAGGIAGGAFKIANRTDYDSPTMTQLIQNGHGSDILRMTNKMHRKGRLLPTNLSIEPQEFTDEGIVFKPANEGEPTLNDFAKNVIEKQIQSAELFLTKEGLDNKSIDKLAMVVANKSEEAFNELPEEQKQIHKLGIYNNFIDSKLDTGIRNDVNAYTTKLVELNKKKKILSKQVDEGLDSPQALNLIDAEYNEVKKELNEIIAVAEQDNDKTDFFVRRTFFSILEDVNSGFGVKNKADFMMSNKVFERNISDEELNKRKNKAIEEYEDYVLNQKPIDVNRALNDFENYESKDPFANYLQNLDEEKLEDLQKKQDFRDFVDLLNFQDKKNKFNFEAFVQNQIQSNTIKKELENTDPKSEEYQALKQKKKELIDNPILNEFVTSENFNPEKLKSSFNLFIQDNGYNEVFPETYKYISDRALKAKNKKEELTKSQNNKVKKLFDKFEIKEFDIGISKDVSSVLSSFYKDGVGVEDANKFLLKVKELESKDEEIDEFIDDVKNLYKKKGIEEVRKEYDDIEVTDENQKLTNEELKEINNISNSIQNNENAIETLDFVEDSLVVNPKSILSDTNIIDRLDAIEQAALDPTDFVDLSGDLEREMDDMISQLKKHASYINATLYFNPIVNQYRKKTKLDEKKIIHKNGNKAAKYIIPLRRELERYNAIIQLYKQQLHTNKQYQLDNLIKQTPVHTREIINGFKSFVAEAEKPKFDRLIEQIEDDSDLSISFDSLAEAGKLLKQLVEKDNTYFVNSNKKGYKTTEISEDGILNPEYSDALKFILANSFIRSTNIDNLISGVKLLAEQSDFSSLGVQDIVLYQVFSFLQNTSNPVFNDKNVIDENLLKLDNSISIDQPAGFGKTSTGIRGAVLFEKMQNPDAEIWYSSIGKKQLEALDKSIGEQATNKGVFTELIEKLGGNYSKRSNIIAKSTSEDVVTYDPFVGETNVDEQLVNDLSNLSLLIIDEATRLNLDQIATINEVVKQHNIIRADNNIAPIRIIYAGDREQISETTKVLFNNKEHIITEGFSPEHIEVETTPTINISFRNQFKYVPQLSTQIRNLNKRLDKRADEFGGNTTNDTAKTIFREEELMFEYFEGQYEGQDDFIGAYHAESNLDFTNKIEKISKLKGSKLIVSDKDKASLISQYPSLEGVDFEVLSGNDTQGGEWDYVMVDNLPYYNYDFAASILNKMLYTIFTRPKKTLILNDFSNYKVDIYNFFDFYNFKDNEKTLNQYPEKIQKLTRNEDPEKDTINRLRQIKLEALEGFEFEGSGKPISSQSPTKVSSIEKFRFTTEFMFEDNLSQFENPSELKRDIINWLEGGDGNFGKVNLVMYDKGSNNLNLAGSLQSYADYVATRAGKQTVNEELDANPIVLEVEVGDKSFKVGTMRLVNNNDSEDVKKVIDFKLAQTKQMEGDRMVIASLNRNNFKRISSTQLSFNTGSEMINYDNYSKRYENTFFVSELYIITEALTVTGKNNKPINYQGRPVVIVSKKPINNHKIDNEKVGDIIVSSLKGVNKNSDYQVILFDKYASSGKEFVEKFKSIAKINYGKFKSTKLSDFIKDYSNIFTKIQFNIALSYHLKKNVFKDGVNINSEITSYTNSDGKLIVKTYNDYISEENNIIDRIDTTKSLNDNIKNLAKLKEDGDFVVSPLSLNILHPIMSSITTDDRFKIDEFYALLENDVTLTSNVSINQLKGDNKLNKVATVLEKDKEKLFTNLIVKQSIAVEPNKVISIVESNMRKNLSEEVNNSIDRIKKALPDNLKNKINDIAANSNDDANVFLTEFNNDIQGYYLENQKPVYIKLNGRNWSDFSVSSKTPTKKSELDSTKVNNINSLPANFNFTDNGLVSVNGTEGKIITYSVDNKMINIKVSQPESEIIKNIKNILGNDFNDKIEQSIVNLLKSDPKTPEFTKRARKLLDIITDTKQFDVFEELIKCTL